MANGSIHSRGTRNISWLVGSPIRGAAAITSRPSVPFVTAASLIVVGASLIVVGAGPARAQPAIRDDHSPAVPQATSPNPSQKACDRHARIRLRIPEQTASSFWTGRYGWLDNPALLTSHLMVTGGFLAGRRTDSYKGLSLDGASQDENSSSPPSLGGWVAVSGPTGRPGLTGLRAGIGFWEIGDQDVAYQGSSVISRFLLSRLKRREHVVTAALAWAGRSFSVGIAFQATLAEQQMAWKLWAGTDPQWPKADETFDLPMHLDLTDRFIPGASAGLAWQPTSRLQFQLGFRWRGTGHLQGSVSSGLIAGRPDIPIQSGRASTLDPMLLRLGRVRLDLAFAVDNLARRQTVAKLGFKSASGTLDSNPSGSDPSGSMSMDMPNQAVIPDAAMGGGVRIGGDTTAIVSILPNRLAIDVGIGVRGRVTGQDDPLDRAHPIVRAGLAILVHKGPVSAELGYSVAYGRIDADAASWTSINPTGGPDLAGGLAGRTAVTHAAVMTINWVFPEHLVR